MAADPIASATGLLSTLMHCRKQAAALQRCKRSGNPAGCDAEEATFVTCSEEHLPLVVSHLVKIAEKHCPNECLEVQRCRTLNPGSDCETEDLFAMRCAALKVLESANARASQ